MNPKLKDIGFRETIIETNLQKTNPSITSNIKTCPIILNTGKKVTNKFFIPSQFPNLTKIRSIKNEINSITGGKYTKRKSSKRKSSKRKSSKRKSSKRKSSKRKSSKRNAKN
jgi:hypothetical protein